MVFYIFYKFVNFSAEMELNQIDSWLVEMNSGESESGVLASTSDPSLSS
jgi:hypothetical protein